MDAARDADTVLAGEPTIDRYLLQLWPAAPAPDAVVRQASEIAAFWHEQARVAQARRPGRRADPVQDVASGSARARAGGPESRADPDGALMRHLPARSAWHSG